MLAIIVIAILIALVLVLAATRPAAFHVERSLIIKTAPEIIFPLINDFHQWELWTPYNKDPLMQKTFNGSASGTGAAYAWKGNKTVGQGEISITDATPPTKIMLDLHMIQPFEGRNVVVFTLYAIGQSTHVTWAMDGKQSFFVKIMGLFFSMDKMVGKDFETGLINLKNLAEK